MDIGSRLVHRAYVLVEAAVPAWDAIEDLITLANGDVDNLRRARRHAQATSVGKMETDPTTLEKAGFEPRLLQIADARRAGIGDLLDRAIASFS